MKTIKLGDTVIEDFRVSNSYHIGVTGLGIGDFEIKIYDGNGIDRTSVITVSLSELTDGNYRILFIPNSYGDWSVYIKHTLYFPYGKAASVRVTDYNIEDIGDMIKRILGLTQENYYVTDTVYDASDNLTSSTIKIYSDSASVGTPNNIIATYNMTASYIDNNLQNYSMKKV